MSVQSECKAPSTGTDPVHQHADGCWYYFDETWFDEHGPYPSEFAARSGLRQYARWLDKGAEAVHDCLDEKAQKGDPARCLVCMSW